MNVNVFCFLFIGGACIMITLWSTGANGQKRWELKAHKNVKKDYSAKLNKTCKIQRWIIGPDGRPIKPPSLMSTTTTTPRAPTPKETTTTTSVTTSSSTTAAARSLYEEDDSEDRSGSFAEVSMPIEDIVIDADCNDEENRAFMECVLEYKPDIKEGDPEYNMGRCMCYRDWSVNSERSPAYNHSLNYTLESHEWFFYSAKHQECIIRNRKRCAPGGTLVVPYRCENDGRCVDSDTDPHFMICDRGRSFSKMPPFLLTALQLVIITFSRNNY